MRPRLGSAIADLSASATADPSRWTHRVGVTGHTRDRHPHLGTPSDLARLLVGEMSVAIGDLSPRRSVLPPLCIEGPAFAAGGGKAAGRTGPLRYALGAGCAGRQCRIGFRSPACAREDLRGHDRRGASGRIQGGGHAVHRRPSGRRVGGADGGRPPAPDALLADEAGGRRRHAGRHLGGDHRQSRRVPVHTWALAPPTWSTASPTRSSTEPR